MAGDSRIGSMSICILPAGGRQSSGSRPRWVSSLAYQSLDQLHTDQYLLTFPPADGHVAEPAKPVCFTIDIHHVPIALRLGAYKGDLK